jgi:hypothetical protein
VRRTSPAAVLRAVPSRTVLPEKGGWSSAWPDHGMQVSSYSHGLGIQDLSSARMSASSVRPSELHAHGVRVSSHLRSSSLIVSSNKGNAIVRGGILLRVCSCDLSHMRSKP